MSAALHSIWRYPVKSMQGERIEAAAVAERGLAGDRGYAVVDRATGHVASAKHPRKWGELFRCRAAFVDDPAVGAPLPAVRITVPDGTAIVSTQPDADRTLSRVCGREVALRCDVPDTPIREADRSPVDRPYTEPLREETMALAAPGTFFDHAPIHIITTATLDHLRALHPAGRFDARRFRPNFVIVTDASGLVENAWPGTELVIGPELRLRIIDPTPRCVVTTLANDALPHDPAILRTVAQHSSAASATLAPGLVLPGVAGVYATAARPGTARVGDQVTPA